MFIKLRSTRWEELVARMGKMRNARKILTGNPEENRSIERPRHRHEYLKEMELTCI
jgi:hypothetical protein